MRKKSVLKAPIHTAKRQNSEIGKSDDSYRTVFMSDRDRILYSKAFRRLDGKTQVFTAHSDDYLRTRLTHTLEVSQIARTIAAGLWLDEDLTEAIALAHDLGHTPFGHEGERALHSIMSSRLKEIGEIGKESPVYKANKIITSISTPCRGFKHNLQGARIVMDLENLYECHGLELTNFTIYGIMHHSGLMYKDSNKDDLDFFDKYHKLILHDTGIEPWSFESFIVSIADEIAQRHHDLEDALLRNIITPDEICALINRYFIEPDFISGTIDWNNVNLHKDGPSFRIYLSKFIVNTLVNRLVDCSRSNLFLFAEQLVKNSPIHFAKFIVNNPASLYDNVISYDIAKVPEDLCHATTEKQDFQKAENCFGREIGTMINNSFAVNRMDSKGKYIIRKLFSAYFHTPTQLHDRTILAYFRNLGNHDYAHLDGKGIGYIRKEFCESLNAQNPATSAYNKTILMRTICDHIAGMTDNYAIEEYHKLY